MLRLFRFLFFWGEILIKKDKLPFSFLSYIFLSYSLKKDVVRINRNNFFFKNGKVLSNLVHEIFIDEVYKCKMTSPFPIIIDCGANIGVASLYFLIKNPLAKIYAFEPDICNFELAKKNLSPYQNVIVEQAAIWVHNNGVPWTSGQTELGGRILDNSSSTVRSVSLANFLKQFDFVDFLKLDIEGAEVKVIEDCQEQLQRVKNIFIEYHSTPEAPQALDVLLKILSTRGFRYYIREDCVITDEPFVYNDAKWGYDLQLQIFGVK